MAGGLTATWPQEDRLFGVELGRPPWSHKSEGGGLMPIASTPVSTPAGEVGTHQLARLGLRELAQAGESINIIGAML